MRLLSLSLVAAVGLVLAAPALAKEPESATLCGADGCASTQDRQTLATMLNDEGPSPPAPQPAAYYRMRVTIDGGVSRGPTFTWWYVPSRRLVLRTGVFGEGMDAWVRMSPAAAALLDRTVRNVKPFAVPVPTRVTIGGKEVADPRSYLRLLTQRTVGIAVPSSGDWQDVRFEGPASPWTNGGIEITFSPKDGLLMRGGEMIKLPPVLADRIAARSSLAPGKAFPWALLGGIAATLALAAAAAVVVRRLSARPRVRHTPAQSEG